MHAAPCSSLQNSWKFQQEISTSRLLMSRPSSTLSDELRPSEKSRRPSRRLSITNWRAKSVSEGCITHVDVFLGSLTSISEELAASLADNARRCGAQVTLESLDKFDPKQFVDLNSTFRTSRLTVFVVSTHVAGKPSPNAEIFLQWLRETPFSIRQSLRVVDPVRPSVPSGTTPKNSLNISPRGLKAESGQHRYYSLTDTLLDNFRLNWRHPFRCGEVENKTEGLLHGIQYAVFGVGNSIYRTYNATAKYIDTRLHELGAVRVCPVGLGDVSKGIEVTYTKWEAQILQNISRQDNYAIPTISNPVRNASTRASLPSITLNTGISIDEIVPGPSMEGPVSLDLEPNEKHNSRKYTPNNNSTSPPTRRVTLDPGAFMPPLTRRR